ncbi:MAG: glycoside hydrolase family 97 catalytic domain-containing protein [Duncaniella sp.]|nr:glycoside hydrolase family 97 catalytic domain-containing protein [Duncaniella sp.]HBI57544.1 alpha-glucosidase [Porphyromonadaceae bacterium]
MKKLFYTLSAILMPFVPLAAKNYVVKSPDKAYKLTVTAGEGPTAYSVDYKGKTVINNSIIGIQTDDSRQIGNGSITSTQKVSHKGKVDVAVGKNKTLDDNYNQLTLVYDGGDYTLTLRAYNEGVAYQWGLNYPGELTVTNELFEADFGQQPVKVFFPQCEMRTWTEYDLKRRPHEVNQAYRNFERAYEIYESIAAIPDSAISTSPALFSIPGGTTKVAITEANVYDYPGLYLQPADGEKIRGHWAGYPKTVLDGDTADVNRYYSMHLVETREDYIAKINGRRSLPWRVVIASDRDADLLNNELVYLLADPCEIDDTSWIEPGASAWEWWHKAVLEGVDFPNGNKNLSLELYKYYVDWAAEHGVRYMTLDAGWSESYLAELCRYAAGKGVGIFVWTWASCPLEAPFDWVKKMKAYGVTGAKIDFFERNDQIAMRWQRQLARRLADENMLVLFHGCPVPSGLGRTFPNVLGYEANRGQECNFWDRTISPRHHCTFPFIRLLVGPTDFTPGSLRQATDAGFKPQDIDNTPPMSQGTVAQEMALFVILDQWIATICDSPTEYAKYPALERFVTQVPVTWDETLPLDGEVGEHILMAKRKGDQWYIGAMTSDSARVYNVTLDFLPADTLYDVEIIADSHDSEAYPRHYGILKRTVRRGDTLPLSLVKAGGAVVKMTPRE